LKPISGQKGHIDNPRGVEEMRLAMLRIENLHVEYAKIPALRGIDIDIKRGEIVALIGANGAGKSTTLKAISGLVRTSAGKIEFDGKSIAGLAPESLVELGIIHVPEGRRIFPRLTVEENLRVGSYPARARAGEKEAREQVYSLFPRLAERRRQPGGALSGGEQQMLAFGRAMMAKPVLLLLDEPSLGLSPILVEEVAQAIDRFHDDGATILLVEQNAELALEMASRGFVIETGRIVLTDTASNLLKNPKVWASYLGREDWEAEADDQGRTSTSST
jgi:branched-chain amino acid transport system ATP-binding protein